MKKKAVLFFVFDGFADWEASYALVGVGKSVAFEVKTISPDLARLKSMGGISVNPDLDFLPGDLNDIDASNTAMLILPGGVGWEKKANDAIAPLVEHCVAHQIPVAAICGATIFLGDLSLLNNRHHTSNHVDYLHNFSRTYRGDKFYQDERAVSSDGIITAGSAAPLEFAARIFETLGIDESKKVQFPFFQLDLVPT